MRRTWHPGSFNGRNLELQECPPPRISLLQISPISDVLRAAQKQRWCHAKNVAVGRDLVAVGESKKKKPNNHTTSEVPGDWGSPGPEAPVPVGV